MSCRVCDAECKGAFMCRPCLRELERAIGDMPALLGHLEDAIARRTNVYRANVPTVCAEEPDGGAEARHERHTRSDGTLSPCLRSKDGRIALRASSLPVNLDAVEVRWDAWNTLTTWARHLAESRGLEPPTMRGLIFWLLKHAESIRFDEAAADIHDEITYAHRQVERAVDRSPERIYAGPCRQEFADFCCVRDLYARPDGEIVCDGHRGDREGCKAEHNVADRNAFIRSELEGRLLPLDNALDALRYWHLDEPPRRIVNDWIRRRRLPEYAIADRPAFPLATLIELVREYNPHKYPETRRKRSVA